MKAFLTCLVLLWFTPAAIPCIWVSGTTYEGNYVSRSGISGARLLKHSLKRNLQATGTQMADALKGHPGFNERNDYAVALMYQGRATEAVALLEMLEAEKPGEYATAANLGTAYELAGQNAPALRWIQEGLRRNPDSHQATEWLHAMILEAKLAQEKDPDYFQQQSVLEIPPGRKGETITVAGRSLTLRELKEAIQYQLGERLQFVKPPDAAVASLLYDYGSIEAGSQSLESARDIFVMASDYGYPRARVQERLDEFDRKIRWRKIKQYGVYVLAGIGGAAILFYLYQKKIFVLTRKDLKPAS